MNPRKLLPLALTVLLALSACGGGDTGASSAVLTEAAIIYAQSVTQTAAAAPPTATATAELPTPTNTALPPTATPTVTGTPPTNTPAPTQPQQQSQGGTKAGCLRAELTYETPADGAQIEVNENFQKRWVLKNVGTCPWTTAFSVVWIQGELFGAKSVQPFSDFTDMEIPPGERIDIGIAFIAPDEQGTYTGYWMLRSDGGTLFGLGPDGRGWFWVEIFAKS
ncbi:MAG: NBR1-Ig-like domain-containing protein [Anaerolineales bacterium]